MVIFIIFILIFYVLPALACIAEELDKTTSPKPKWEYKRPWEK